MNNPFPSSFEEFIYKSRYARWLPEQNRREEWDETVHRLVDYYADQIGLGVFNETKIDIWNVFTCAILFEISFLIGLIVWIDS